MIPKKQKRNQVSAKKGGIFWETLYFEILKIFPWKIFGDKAHFKQKR